VRGVRRRRRPAPWVPPGEDDGYRGPARLRVGDLDLEVEIHLAGHLEPLDGRFHWYGRVQRDAAVTAAKEGGAVRALLTVRGGQPAEARLAEVDAWGNIQVSGYGAPPYPRDAVEIELPA
jgi:hypothetical protein